MASENQDKCDQFLYQLQIYKDYIKDKADITNFWISTGLNRQEIMGKNDASVPWHMQIEFTDNQGKKWYMDQAERFNAFNFNKFKGWFCNAGYQGIIIREPDGSIKRSYSCHDAPLGNIETGFKLFNKSQVCITESCVSSADSKIPKRKYGISTRN